MNFDEYERKGQAAYADLAKTVAKILTVAISVEKSYRLQQVKEREKQPASLRKKLEKNGIAATAKLESDIKDLAGCRVIFYTDGDVTRFINSGIINQNFEVVDHKLHHPGREVDDATELYISNHYLVRLRPERIALPEYARFTGMQCEIQIQTILNHAWAEMAHDTIYKAPTLGDFGSKAFDGIKSRMQKIARKYLLPAGYEFQKIATDFQRLIEGKALFDGDALEAIVEAADNNIRAEVLETFAENVLPLYDDLNAMYPEIVARLVEAANRAKTTMPIAIETPYGTLPAKTFSDIIEGISDILTRYRYFDVEITFDALCKLYSWAESEDERKPLRALGKTLAKHQLNVWRQGGPIVQTILVERIEALSEDERLEVAPLLTEMLGEVLGAEVSGTTNSSSTMSFHRGSVIASDALRILRTRAIVLLQLQFAAAEDDKKRGVILLTLQAATRPPMSTGYSNELALIVMDDTRAILDFQTKIAPTLNFDLLQTTEDRVLRCYWMYAELPESMRDDPALIEARSQLLAAALAFRDVANSTPDFMMYKILIGFNSVFPPAWKDKEFHYEQQRAYRSEQVNSLLATINTTNADTWFDRISRFARTESNDAATFPVFGDFLDRLAEAQPNIVFSYIDRMEKALTNFLPAMLAGLMRSAERAQALARINAWLNAGEHIGAIAWYLGFANPFDETLLRRTLESAIQYGDRHAVRNALVAAVKQFETYPGTVVQEIFLPALRYLVAADDFSWVRMTWHSWLRSPILRALNEEQAAIVLDALVSYPELEYDSEHIVAAIAKQWPAKVVAFIGKRQTFARTDAKPPHYDAVPFAVHELKAPLAAVPDIVLDGARIWFDADPRHFPFDGGRLIASVFPDLSNGLEARLAVLIAGGNEQDLAFALGILSAFEGRPNIYGLVRTIIASLSPDHPLLLKARSVLHESGTVSGTYGFAELHAGRKTLLEGWLTDTSPIVRAFAGEQIQELDRLIAAENRSAEASLALRKLEYGEEVDVGEGEPE